ncbi:MAG: class I SAM-dependent methyltransferase [Candidatus Aenigmarchaeota archaeon]|nr:class I SAM-dependent methyltransferase [Candidatus Aenigmarchaeota archaeon]
MSDEDVMEDFILERGENRKKILDVGCGDGKLLIKLAERNKSSELYCVDLHAEYARSNIERDGYSHRIKCITAKAEDIPLEDRSFDLIFCLRSLHEFSDPVKSLQEIKRMLAPDGEAIIIDWRREAETGVREKYYGKREIREFMEKAEYDTNNIKIKEVNRFNIVLYIQDTRGE